MQVHALVGMRRAVERVAHDRMAQGLQVHPQLMGAARVGLQGQATAAAIGLQQPPVGAAGLAPLMVNAVAGGCWHLARGQSIRPSSAVGTPTTSAT